METELQFWTKTNYDDKQYKPLVVDSCLAEITQNLHSCGIRTYGSCCGHFNLCGGFIIDSHSVYNALRSCYDVSKQWMVDCDGREFVIYHLNLLNNCKDCRSNFDPICQCYCSCHGELN